MSAKSRLLLSVLAIAISIYVVWTEPKQLGLDLKGGTQVVLDLKPRDGQPVTSDLADRTLEVMRRRVDSLGVSEPNIEVQGNKRILVELPGVSDPQQAVSVIGSTAQLTIHPVTGTATQQAPTATTAPGSAPSPSTTIAQPDPGTTATTSLGLGANNELPTVLGQETTSTTATPTETPTTVAAEPTATTSQTGAITAVDDNGVAYTLGPSVITGDGIAGAQANPPDQNHSAWYLTIDFKGDGAKAWTKLTGEEACNTNQNDVTRQSAFVLDGKIIQMSGPASTIQCGVGITGNTTEVTSSNFDQKTVQKLALLIRGGALPVDVSIAEQQTIGPELGKAAIHDSIQAVLIGGILTVIYILIYYRFLGVLASLALGAYALISLAVLKGLGLTLTLPGIAGFVLAIAMAMDSNILVYERVKEEFAHGRSVRQASQMGFKNALSAIIDSNATTFIAALTLFFLAVGEVKGFGVTLLVGTAVSIFTTLIILRTLVTGTLGTEAARNRPKALGLYVGAKFRQRMSENPPNLMKWAKYFGVVSIVAVIVCVSGIFVKGINYGLEFSGGRLIEYQTSTLVDVDKAREKVAELGFPTAVIQRSDKVNTSIRVKELNNEQSAKLDAIMKDLGGGEAKRVEDSTIGPSFGKELKKKAVIGLIIGVGLQLCWVAYRFRWTFGIGAVVGMLHDAIIVLGLFAWFGKSFDAVFLAALLTIIAYSVNDSVVVFDRIREQRRRRASESFARVVSDACAQTFPRTLNIGLSALFILGALYFLGGKTLGDFSLALIIGVITGIYSSVMVASPIAVLLERLKPSLSAAKTVPATKRQRPDNKPKATKPVTDAEGNVVEDAEGSDTQRQTSRPAPRPRKKSSKKRR